MSSPRAGIARGGRALCIMLCLVNASSLSSREPDVLDASEYRYLAASDVVSDTALVTIGDASVSAARAREPVTISVAVILGIAYVVAASKKKAAQDRLSALRTDSYGELAEIREASLEAMDKIAALFENAAGDIDTRLRETNVALTMKAVRRLSVAGLLHLVDTLGSRHAFDVKADAGDSHFELHSYEQLFTVKALADVLKALNNSPDSPTNTPSSSSASDLGPTAYIHDADTLRVFVQQLPPATKESNEAITAAVASYLQRKTIFLKPNFVEAVAKKLTEHMSGMPSKIATDGAKTPAIHAKTPAISSTMGWPTFKAKLIDAASAQLRSALILMIRQEFDTLYNWFASEETLGDEGIIVLDKLAPALVKGSPLLKQEGPSNRRAADEIANMQRIRAESAQKDFVNDQRTDDAKELIKTQAVVTLVTVANSVEHSVRSVAVADTMKVFTLLGPLLLLTNTISNVRDLRAISGDERLDRFALARNIAIQRERARSDAKLSLIVGCKWLAAFLSSFDDLIAEKGTQTGHSWGGHVVQNHASTNAVDKARMSLSAIFGDASLFFSHDGAPQAALSGDAIVHIAASSEERMCEVVSPAYVRLAALFRRGGRCSTSLLRPRDTAASSSNGAPLAGAHVVTEASVPASGSESDIFDIVLTRGDDDFTRFGYEKIRGSVELNADFLPSCADADGGCGAATPDASRQLVKLTRKAITSAPPLGSSPPPHPCATRVAGFGGADSGAKRLPIQDVKIVSLPRETSEKKDVPGKVDFTELEKELLSGDGWEVLLLANRPDATSGDCVPAPIAAPNQKGRVFSEDDMQKLATADLNFGRRGIADKSFAPMVLVLVNRGKRGNEMPFVVVDIANVPFHATKANKRTSSWRRNVLRQASTTETSIDLGSADLVAPTMGAMIGMDEHTQLTFDCPNVKAPSPSCRVSDTVKRARASSSIKRRSRLTFRTTSSRRARRPLYPTRRAHRFGLQSGIALLSRQKMAPRSPRAWSWRGPSCGCSDA